jgi:tetratricopeptide (TPR) repeat protein
MTDQPADPERRDAGERPETGEAAERPDQAEDADAVARRRRAIARGAPRPFSDDERETAYGLLQRGLALMLRRHYAQAAVVLERAAALEPGRGSIVEALGRACYNSAQHERARETFEALLEIDPSSHYGHYALGQSLKQLGRRREARAHLRLAVALHPESRLYRSALSRLGPATAEVPDRGHPERGEPEAGQDEPGEPGPGATHREGGSVAVDEGSPAADERGSTGST